MSPNKIQMILYVHSKLLPLNTFLVNAKANWTILRVRGYLLHRLAEIGHHRSDSSIINKLFEKGLLK